MPYYDNKQATYYNNVRDDLIALIPLNPEQCLLEVGAGAGDTLVAIKENKVAKTVIGIDLFALRNTNQAHPSIDKFIILDIEKHELPFKHEFFDTIICGDVLEHLVDPWLIIKKLTRYIKLGGILIISVPNIRHYSVIYKIVAKGRFEYNPDGGILDKTHLRFFCRHDVKDLLTINELEVQKILPIHYHSKYRFGKKIQLFNILTAGLFEEFLVHQYLAVAKRTS